MSYDIDEVRSRFPALTRTEHGVPVAWLDGPGGTQVPESVIRSIGGLLEAGVSNHGGAFAASRDGELLTDDARSAVADLIGSDADEIVFGQNMTSLTLAMSRSIAREWAEGDNVVVTTLDHDANVAPWRLVAADHGVEVRTVPFESDTGMIDPAKMAAAFDDRTRLVAVTAASNALGSLTELQPIVDAAHECGALTYIDAVHHSAHRLSDVHSLGTDFLVASAYKFFGPHTGILYGRRPHLERLTPYKVRPAPEAAPDRWETGTQSFESLVAVTAAIDHLASLGEGATRRSRLEDAFASIATHEESLSRRFLAGLAEMPEITPYGPGPEGRVSTFAIDIAGMHPARAAEALGERGLYTWSGDYYAVGVMEQLGRSEVGGLIRIGFVHYTSSDEVDRLLEALEDLAATA